MSYSVTEMSYYGKPLLTGGEYLRSCKSLPASSCKKKPNVVQVRVWLLLTKLILRWLVRPITYYNNVKTS